MLGVSDVGKLGSEPRQINPRGGSRRFRKNQSIQSYCDGVRCEFQRDCECTCRLICGPTKCDKELRCGQCYMLKTTKQKFKRRSGYASMPRISVSIAISPTGGDQGTYAVFIEQLDDPVVVMLVIHLVQHLPRCEEAKQSLALILTIIPTRL